MRSDSFVEKILQLGLIRKREEFLRKQSIGSPNDHTLFEKLADVCRQQGKLAEAAKFCREWLAVEPASKKAMYLAAIFNNMIPPGSFPDKGFAPSPFYRQENFLSRTVHDDLLSFAKQSEENFLPSPVYYGNSAKGLSDPEFRSSREAILPSHLIDPLWEDVKALVPALCRNFMMPEFKPNSARLRMVHYGDGDYGKAHKDDCGDLQGITAVYYLSFPQAAFEGGDFILFDMNKEKDELDRARFTQIPFADNQLIAFPNNVFHEILPVSCPGNRFEDGRFTIPIHIFPKNK